MLSNAAVYGTSTNNNVTEAQFQTFINAYRLDPGAVVDYAQVIAQLSPGQFERMTHLLNTSHFTYLHPVVIRASEISTTINSTIDQLSLMAVREGRLIPIPFQFDELDQTGLVYIPKQSKHPIDGKQGVFDKSDELLFMYRDAGIARAGTSAVSQLQGKILKEITLQGSDGSRRYAYLVADNPKRSRVSYVQSDLDTGKLETTYLTMHFDTDNMLEIQSIRPKIGSKRGANVVDAIYAELSSGIFNRNLRLKFNTRKNIKARPKAVKEGPIRSTILIDFRMTVGGIPVMKNDYNVSCYEQAFNLRSRFSGDGFAVARYAAFILKEPRFSFGMRFSGLEGARVSFDSVSDEGYALVDGSMDTLEQRIAQKRLPGNWLWLSSGHGWDMFLSNSLPVVPGGLFDAFLEGMALSMVYQDTGEQASPFIGVEGKGLPVLALKLMSAIKDIKFEQLDTFNEALDLLIELDEQGKLDKANALIQQKLKALRETGMISDTQSLADAYVADMSLIGVSGITPEELNELSVYAIREYLSFDDVSIGKVLKGFKTRAAALNIDLSNVQYKPLDNTLYLPDTVGDAGPAAFFKEVSQPPHIVVGDYVPTYPL